MIYAAHTKQWQQLWQAKCSGRLPHALLFIGAKGTHKAKLADDFSRALLCSQVTAIGEPCQQCHACRLIMGKAHPNVLWLEPEKAGAAIKVDQIRVVSEFISLTSLQGEYRIVIVHPADNMNISAANALLKTLEEPAPGAVLILISDQQHPLPATILSRCQRIVFSGPTKVQTSEWLASQPYRQDLFQALINMADGHDDPVKLAAALHNNDPIQMLDFLLSWIVDLLKLQLNSDTNQLANADYTDTLVRLSVKTHLKLNVNLMDKIQQLRGQLGNGINFNKQLMLESIFMGWMECVGCF